MRRPPVAATAVARSRSASTSPPALSIAVGHRHTVLILKRKPGRFEPTAVGRAAEVRNAVARSLFVGERNDLERAGRGADRIGDLDAQSTPSMPS